MISLFTTTTFIKVYEVVVAVIPKCYQNMLILRNRFVMFYSKRSDCLNVAIDDSPALVNEETEKYFFNCMGLYPFYGLIIYIYCFHCCSIFRPAELAFRLLVFLMEEMLE